MKGAGWCKWTNSIGPRSVHLSDATVVMRGMRLIWVPAPGRCAEEPGQVVRTVLCRSGFHRGVTDHW